jgi:hypothetical protein
VNFQAVQVLDKRTRWGTANFGNFGNFGNFSGVGGARPTMLLGARA